MGDCMDLRNWPADVHASDHAGRRVSANSSYVQPLGGFWTQTAAVRDTPAPVPEPVDVTTWVWSVPALAVPTK